MILLDDRELVMVVLDRWRLLERRRKRQMGDEHPGVLVAQVERAKLYALVWQHGRSALLVPISGPNGDQIRAWPGAPPRKWLKQAVCVMRRTGLEPVPPD
jgi:hypothetical protein